MRNQLPTCEGDLTSLEEATSLLAESSFSVIPKDGKVDSVSYGFERRLYKKKV